MKIVIYLFTMLLVLGSVSAYSAGQNVTQQQIDNLNTNNLVWQDFKPSIVSHSLKQATWSDFRYFQTDISILDIKPSGNDYEIQNITFSVTTPVYKVVEVIQNHNKTFAISEYNKRLVKYTLNYIDSIKLRVNDYKTGTETIPLQDIILEGDTN